MSNFSGQTRPPEAGAQLHEVKHAAEVLDCPKSPEVADTRGFNRGQRTLTPDVSRGARGGVAITLKKRASHLGTMGVNRTNPIDASYALYSRYAYRV